MSLTFNHSCEAQNPSPWCQRSRQESPQVHFECPSILNPFWSERRCHSRRRYLPYGRHISPSCPLRRSQCPIHVCHVTSRPWGCEQHQATNQCGNDKKREDEESWACGWRKRTRVQRDIFRLGKACAESWPKRESVRANIVQLRKTQWLGISAYGVSSLVPMNFSRSGYNIDGAGSLSLEMKSCGWKKGFFDKLAPHKIHWGSHKRCHLHNQSEEIQIRVNSHKYMNFHSFHKRYWIILFRSAIIHFKTKRAQIISISSSTSCVVHHARLYLTL